LLQIIATGTSSDYVKFARYTSEIRFIAMLAYFNVFSKWAKVRPRTSHEEPDVE